MVVQRKRTELAACDAYGRRDGVAQRSIDLNGVVNLLITLNGIPPAATDDRIERRCDDQDIGYKLHTRNHGLQAFGDFYALEPVKFIGIDAGDVTIMLIPFGRKDRIA